MKTKGILAALAALAIIIAVILMQKFSGPDLSSYLELKDPAIRVMEPEKVLVVEARGAPNKAAKDAFGLLMKTYFGLKGVPKGKGMPAPRARWPLDPSIPSEQWLGRYAMPLPDTVNDIRFPEVPKGMSIKVATWRYGKVAEILHVGPYSEEKPTIERLYGFIRDQHYVTVGEHEEEYLKGPGVIFKGNPKEYMTIIRYPVQKKRQDSGSVSTAKAVQGSR
ncbi:MAG: hypothetical protein JXA71_04030 [Chitinispirillaceae bacterium]|nr:hypothetical protein [Chitinispirillaceae bacterium]